MDKRIGRSFDDIWQERSIRLDKKPVKRFKMYRDEDHSKSKVNKMALRGIYECSRLSDLFFSPENVQNLQHKIRYSVWKMSNHLYIIDEQDIVELSIIMRSLYLQYSKNMDKEITQQISELNTIVTDEVVPKILSNIQQFVIYLRDKQKPYRPIPRAKNVSSAGLKSLRIDTAIGF